MECKNCIFLPGLNENNPHRFVWQKQCLKISPPLGKYNAPTIQGAANQLLFQQKRIVVHDSVYQSARIESCAPNVPETPTNPGIKNLSWWFTNWRASSKDLALSRNNSGNFVWKVPNSWGECATNATRPSFPTPTWQSGKSWIENSFFITSWGWTTFDLKTFPQAPRECEVEYLRTSLHCLLNNRPNEAPCIGRFRTSAQPGVPGEMSCPGTPRKWSRIFEQNTSQHWHAHRAILKATKPCLGWPCWHSKQDKELADFNNFRLVALLRICALYSYKIRRIWKLFKCVNSL